MCDIIFQSATDLSRAIQSKKISSQELTQLYLTRISEVNPTINAVVQTKPEQTLQIAKQRDEQLARGEIMGPLHGVPVTIKDTVDVEGFICTEGTIGFKNRLATEDGTVVARLKSAGAIILGLTNAPEAACAFETDNLIYGRSNNPFNVNLSPGGSSGGEAAIIAVAGTSFGLGSDGGGSIRAPAHFCGITGIKPTIGRIPLSGLLIPRHGIGSFIKFGTFGPMARFVDDLILSLPILNGPDHIDPTIAPVPLQDPHNIDLITLRVGFFTNNGIAEPTEATRLVVASAAKELTKYVASMTESCPTNIENTYGLLWGGLFEGGDGSQGAINFLRQIGTDTSSNLLQQFLESSSKNILTTEQRNAQLAEFDGYRFRLHEYMHDFDVILSPVCATPAKPHGTSFDHLKDYTYTMMHNITGWPSVVVRCGTSPEGLPIGIQITARNWRDDVALAVAKQLEEIFGGWQIPQNFQLSGNVTIGSPV